MKKMLSLIFLSASLYAEEAKGSSDTFDFLGDFLNMALTLAFVLGLAFVSILFLKKIMRSKMREMNKATGIKVLERRALSAKSSLYLLDVLGKGVLVGESQAGGIQLLTEFPSGTDIELLLEEETQVKISKVSLTQKFSKFFKKEGVS